MSSWGFEECVGQEAVEDKIDNCRKEKQAQINRTEEQKVPTFGRLGNNVSHMGWIQVVTGLEQARNVCI